MSEITSSTVIVLVESVARVATYIIATYIIASYTYS